MNGRPTPACRTGRSDVRRWELPNGLRVLYRQDASFPLASATLLLRTGSCVESRSEAGLSSMTLDLLMQGTHKRNARSIARVMESVGASMGTQAHEDYCEMGFIVPGAEIPRALELTSEVLREPSFPSEEIAKEKSHVEASLTSRRDAIFNLAYDQLNKTLYGNHPYGRPLEGRVETVRGFRRRDFQKWHSEKIRPEGAILSLIGPMPARQVEKMVGTHFSKWRGPTTSSSGMDLKATGPRLTDRRGDIVIRSNFEQAYLMVGFFAPEATHPDQTPLKVLNTLLGGGMSSRLFVELREKLGLAYEVSAFYPTRLERSQWVIYLGLPAERLKVASQKLNELLEKLAGRGPTSDDVRQAKAMIRGAFIMDRQSRRRQAWYNAWWDYLGHGPDYDQEFLKKVDQVSAKTLQNLLRKILSQPRVTVKVIPK